MIMKKTTNYLFLAAVCVAIFFASCKNDTKTAASNTVQENANAAKAVADAAAKATADSIAMAEAAALAVAKEDSIAKATAAAEAAAKGKQTKVTPKPTAKPTAKPATKPTPKPSTATTLPMPKKPTTPPVAIPTKKDGNIKKRTGKDDVIVIADVKPVYPGGVGAMMEYVKKNIKYPIKAKEEGVKGTVYVQFVVEKDGSVAEVNVARGINPLLDAEAKRVVSSMPKWAAGKQNGKDVAVQYTLPVKFELIE